MTRQEMREKSEQLSYEIKFGCEIEYSGISRRNSALIVHSVMESFFPDDEVYIEKDYDRTNDIYRVYREYNNNKDLYFSVVHDGSIPACKLDKDGYLVHAKAVFRNELVSRPFTRKDFPLICAVIDALKKGSVVDNQRMIIASNMGIHIHLSADFLSVQSLKALCYNVFSKQNLLYHATAQSLTTDRYQYMQCLPEKFVSALAQVKDFEQLRDVYYKSLITKRTNVQLETNKKYSKARYFVLNLCPLYDYRGYKTVEFRLFRSSTSSQEIICYVLFCMKFLAYCSLIQKSSYRELEKIDTEPRSEKYRMHCFLQKIFCTGDEYKEVRKVFLKHLKGKAAWR